MARTLTRAHIQAIEAFRITRRMDIVQLRQAMDAPFRWSTLLRALRGKPVRTGNWQFLIQWIAKHAPLREVPDGKAAAAGEIRADEAVRCAK